MVRALVLLAGFLSACATFDAAAITADRAATDRGEELFGWDVVRDDDARVVRWRECSSPTDCSATLHERSSADLERVVPNGTQALVSTNGLSRTVDVSRLSFGPP